MLKVNKKIVTISLGMLLTHNTLFGWGMGDLARGALCFIKGPDNYVEIIQDHTNTYQFAKDTVMDKFVSSQQYSTEADNAELTFINSLYPEELSDLESKGCIVRTFQNKFQIKHTNGNFMTLREMAQLVKQKRDDQYKSKKATFSQRATYFLGAVAIPGTALVIAGMAAYKGGDVAKSIGLAVGGLAMHGYSCMLSENFKTTPEIFKNIGFPLLLSISLGGMTSLGVSSGMNLFRR